MWEEAVEKVLERMNSALKTLVQCDLFPTNIVVNQERGKERVGIVDWAYSGEMPYFLKLGRFTEFLKVIKSLGGKGLYHIKIIKRFPDNCRCKRTSSVGMENYFV